MTVNSPAQCQPRLDGEKQCAPLATRLLLVLAPSWIRDRIRPGDSSPSSLGSWLEWPLRKLAAPVRDWQVDERRNGGAARFAVWWLWPFWPMSLTQVPLGTIVSRESSNRRRCSSRTARGARPLQLVLHPPASLCCPLSVRLWRAVQVPSGRYFRAIGATGPAALPPTQ